ncbi:TLR adapter interacting with SLC15A4 on the lysosome-like [Pelobates fuscus]|uniref:TLR adapter interacting with SLC15A4 on the lysosome-like n=1 Tax=Pelobates fuscus TaxID=191477 RepID=UPI002FE460DB
MLAEAFLCRIVYEGITDDGKQQSQEKSNKKQAISSLNATSKNGYGDLLETQKVFRPGGQTLGHRHDDQFCESSEEVCIQYRENCCEHASGSMNIPKKSQDNESQLDLYTSWSSLYASIYKDYPDMHIAGHHILNKMDSGCVLDYEGELQDGPVLLSADIARNTPPAEMTGVLDHLHAHNSMEARERSITLPHAPFSNSVLNGYMEKEMQELYKQFIEENQVVGGSFNPMASSSFLTNNVNQTSTNSSHERNRESHRARKAFLNYLRSAASGISSEFDTPVLQISNKK